MAVAKVQEIKRNIGRPDGLLSNVLVCFGRWSEWQTRPGWEVGA
jgi:hypothetical protein